MKITGGAVARNSRLPTRPERERLPGRKVIVSNVSPAVLEALLELKRAPLFSAVGAPFVGDFVRAPSWAEALARNDAGWEDVQTEAANELRVAVARRSQADYQRWNEVVADLRPSVEDLVDDRATLVARAEGLDQAFIDTVRWDLLHWLLEVEFGCSGLYSLLAKLYVQGHWPCGWEGAWPSGRLVVY